jgi:hypothetical protein
MKVFISWSGEVSRAVANNLRDWLPKVLQEVEPFVSTVDLQAGDRWGSEIAAQLNDTSFGIVCVTGDNQERPWLNFEAGAIAKAVGHSRVVPLAIDLELADIKQPLGQFNGRKLDKDGIASILRSLNERCDRGLDKAALEQVIEVWWPHLSSSIATIRNRPLPKEPKRDERDLLDEILVTVRHLAHNARNQDEDEDAPVSSYDQITLNAAQRVLASFLPVDGWTWHASGGEGSVYIHVEVDDEIDEDAAREVWAALRRLGVDGVSFNTALGSGPGLSLP